MSSQPNKGGAPKGNQNATKNKPFADAVRRVLVQEPKQLEAAARALIQKAVAGDSQAVKELADRLDGKPHQTIAADIDANVTVEVVRFGARKAAK